MCGNFPSQPIFQLYEHQMVVLKFSSDANYPELVQIWQVKGSVPQDWTPFRMPVTSSRLLPYTSDQRL